MRKVWRFSGSEQCLTEDKILTFRSKNIKLVWVATRTDPPLFLGTTVNIKEPVKVSKEAGIKDTQKGEIEGLWHLSKGGPFHFFRRGGDTLHCYWNI